MFDRKWRMGEGWVYSCAASGILMTTSNNDLQDMVGDKGWRTIIPKKVGLSLAVFRGNKHYKIHIVSSHLLFFTSRQQCLQS